MYPPEVHEVSRGGRRLDVERAELVQACRQRGHSSCGGYARPKPDEHGVRGRKRGALGQQAAQFAHGDGRSLSQAEGVAEGREHSDADDCGPESLPAAQADRDTLPEAPANGRQVAPRARSHRGARAGVLASPRVGGSPGALGSSPSSPRRSRRYGWARPHSPWPTHSQRVAGHSGDGGLYTVTAKRLDGGVPGDAIKAGPGEQVTQAGGEHQRPADRRDPHDRPGDRAEDRHRRPAGAAAQRQPDTNHRRHRPERRGGRGHCPPARGRPCWRGRPSAVLGGGTPGGPGSARDRHHDCPQESGSENQRVSVKSRVRLRNRGEAHREER